MADGTPTGYLARRGAKLIDNGYDIIPIRRGSKAPPFDKWSEVRADRKLLRAWLDGSAKVVVGGEKRAYKGERDGVGLLTYRTPGVDLDIRDAEMSRKMREFVELLFGEAPVRVGMAPKQLLMFRTDKPFSKVQSATYIDPFSDELDDGKPIKHKVEILGAGQQFVCFAKHPDTGQPYKWLDEQSPLTTKWEDLPALSEDDAQQIVAEFERLAEEAGWEKHKSSIALSGRLASRGSIDDDDPFAADADKVEIDEDEFVKKLHLVPGADEYDVWLQVGMALFHQYDGEARGLELWHEWSEQAANYDSDALDEKWDTFDISNKGRAPITARLILKLAKEVEEETERETLEEIRAELAQVTDLANLRLVCNRMKTVDLDPLTRTQLTGMVQDRFKAITNQRLSITVARDMIRFENTERKATPPKWLEGFVYCQFDETFYSIADRISLSTTAFNQAFGRYLLTKQEKLEGKSTPEQTPSQVALNLYEIPVVFDRRYLPGEDDLFWMNGVRYVNTYDGRNVPEVPEELTKRERRHVAIVDYHFEHLFPHVRDREILKDAIAWIVQNPGRRLNWAIIIQGTEGDGKTYFFRLLAAVLAMENVTTIGPQAVEEKYTPWAEGHQVCFVEEIRLHGHNRYDVMNRLKPLITNAVVPIRRMNVDTYMVPNTQTYLAATNYKDALPLSDNDTRYFVMFSRWQSKEQLDEFKEANPEYYDKLHDAINESPGAVRKWLLEREIPDTFKPEGRAPESVARAEMVSYSKSEEQEALEEILASSPRLDMTKILLNSTDLADEFDKIDAEIPYGRALARLLLDNGFTRLGKVNVDGKSKLFWSQQPAKFMGESGGKIRVNPDKVRDWVSDPL